MGDGLSFSAKQIGTLRVRAAFANGVSRSYRSLNTKDVWERRLVETWDAVRWSGDAYKAEHRGSGAETLEHERVNQSDEDSEDDSDQTADDIDERGDDGESAREARQKEDGNSELQEDSQGPPGEEKRYARAHQRGIRQNRAVRSLEWAARSLKDRGKGLKSKTFDLTARQPDTVESEVIGSSGTVEITR